MSQATETGLRQSLEAFWLRLAPMVFVVLFSAGFVGAKYGLPYAGPMTFLTLRMGLVVVLLGALVLATQAKWPRPRDLVHAAIAGLGLQFAYLGGVFAGISHGLPAGETALVTGLQPVLTAALAPLVLREKVRPLQWLGFLLGLAGVVLVVWTELRFSTDIATGLLFAIGALLGITFGTLYQKRFCPVIDLRVGALAQYVVSFVAFLPFAIWDEGFRVTWTVPFIGALLFLVLFLSLGAVLLLLSLLRRGAASRVVSLFFLVPPCTALIAYLVFGEALTPFALAGLALTALGVALVSRG
jgi:drug/metabolite transporter (DMT)-like permease